MHHPAVPNHAAMTTVPKEINAAAARGSPAEKVTPMMHRDVRR